ncbi:thioredoxin-like protein, partial [Lophiotrema nucula]
MATVQQIADERSFQSTISALPPSTLAVIYFHALWAVPCKQLAVVLDALASTYATDAPIKFLALDVDAEGLNDILEQYDVTAVPLIVLQKEGKVLETVSGSDATKVRAAVEKYAAPGGQEAGLPPAQLVSKPQNGSYTESSNGDKPKSLAAYTPSASDPKTAPEYSSGELTSEEELHKRLSELTKVMPVMLFMKGTPTAPQCGFSREAVSILRSKGVQYGYFNILADDEVRQGMKKFSIWPTYPQLYVKGVFEGGLDILKEELKDDPDWLKK